MALSPEQIAKMQAIAGKDKFPTLQQTEQRKQILTEAIPTPPKQKGLARRAVGAIARGIAEPFARFGTQAVNLGEATVDLMRGDVSGAGEALEKRRSVPGLGEVAPFVTGKEDTGEFLAKTAAGGLDIASTLVGGGGAATVAKTGAKGLAKEALKVGAREGVLTGAAQGLSSSLEEGDSAAEMALDTAGGAAAGLAFGAAAGSIPGIAKSAVRGARKTFAPIETETKMAIREGIDKGIKPYFSNKVTPQAREKFYEKATEAFQIIHKIKPRITDTATEITEKRSPRTRAEMLEALDRSKKVIFKQYNKIAQEAGEKGVVFDASGVLSDMRSIANNKEYSPNIRQYVKSAIKDIKELDGETPVVVQSRIRELNEMASGFFTGRTDKVKSRVDASIAAKMRKALDETISKSTDQKYQALKNSYGSLLAVEKDLVRQVALEARKNNKSLIDYTDIFTGSDILSGLVTANPAMLVSGLAGRTAKEYIKFINNPNRFIKKAFEALEKQSKTLNK